MMKTCFIKVWISGKVALPSFSMKVRLLQTECRVFIMTQTLAENIDLAETVEDGVSLDLEDLDLMIKVKKI